MSGKPMQMRRVSDEEPGIRRIRCGKGFRYLRPDGRPVGSEDRRRCKALVVPPAWEEVWICPHADGHIQATGRDKRGRKQYIYHEAWRLQRDAEKFERLRDLAEELPALREQVQVDLRRNGLPREKVLAAVVRLIERSFIRVGTSRYADENRSYGASTLLHEHVRHVHGQEVLLRFVGKGGRTEEVTLDDPRLSRVVQQCQDQAGTHLFSYDDGTCDVDSDDVAEYIRAATGGPFTGKDLRTWSASVLLLHRLHQKGPRRDKRSRHAVLGGAVKEVATCLHNTPAVCKKSYLHPFVAAAYLDGSLDRRLEDPPRIEGLWPEERRLVALLDSYA